MPGKPWRQAPMPARTKGGRFHAGHGLDQFPGDTGWAIRQCAKRPADERFIDLNFQPGEHLIWNLHSRTAAENGYRYLQVRPGKRRAMTNVELHRDIEDWPDADIRRWRRTPRWGRALAARTRPGTFGERVRLAQRKRVTICAELKWPVTHVQAVQLVAYTIARRTTVFFMALVHQGKTPPPGTSMAPAGRKAKAITGAGGQFALLTHGLPVPHDLEQWRPHITQFWGTNAKEYR